MKRALLTAGAAFAAGALLIFGAGERGPDPAGPAAFTGGPPATQRGPASAPADTRPVDTSSSRIPAAPAWAVVHPNDVDARRLPPRIRADANAVLVAIERDRVAMATPGSELLLPGLKGTMHSMKIERISDHADFGVTSIRGHIAAGGRQLPAIITLGKDTTFATLSTTAGIVEVRGDGRLAWMFADGPREGSRNSVVDYVRPPRGAR